MNPKCDGVHTELVEAMPLDLVGPDNDHVYAHELLLDVPSRWYLIGLLANCAIAQQPLPPRWQRGVTAL